MSYEEARPVEFWGPCPGKGGYRADCNRGFSASVEQARRRPVGRFSGDGGPHVLVRSAPEWRRVESAPLAVCIAGGGIGGLALAFWLLQKGTKVRVHEALKRPGGLLWTRTVGGAPAEHGPSYFLESHSCMRGLLRDVGVEEERAEPLSGKWLLEGDLVEASEIRTFFATLLDKCEDNVPLEFSACAVEGRALPFWEDIKYGTRKDAQDFFAPALRPAGGYSKLVETLVQKIKELDGDAIVCGSRIESVRPVDEHAVAVRVGDRPGEEHACSRLFLAIPPQALLRVQAPRELSARLRSFARSRAWIRSMRVYAHFARAPDKLVALWENGVRHVFWRDSPMGWVNLEGPCGKGWRLFFYLDGDRADRAYRFLRFRRKSEVDLAQDLVARLAALLQIPAFEVGEASVGGGHGPSAMHPRIGPEASASETEVHPRVTIAGEAARSDMYGWTEASLLASRSGLHLSL